MQEIQRVFTTDFGKELSRSGEIKTYKAGSVILNMDAYVHSIPVILSGSIKVIRTEENGRELLLYYIRPGESCIVSIISGMTQDTSKVKAIVEEDAEILLISIDKTKTWIKMYPEWTDFIFDLYQKRFESLLNTVHAIAFHRVDQRILELLKKKEELFQTKEITVTHQKLADELGITREATSRTLKQMEKEGIISLSRNCIHLL